MSVGRHLFPKCLPLDLAPRAILLILFSDFFVHARYNPAPPLACSLSDLAAKNASRPLDNSSRSMWQAVMPGNVTIYGQ